MSEAYKKLITYVEYSWVAVVHDTYCFEAENYLLQELEGLTFHLSEALDIELQVRSHYE